MEDIKSLVAGAKQREDQSVVQAGGDFTYVPPTAGRTVGRFIEYIELGDHVTLYEGKPKPAAPQVRVTFELLMNNDNRKDVKEIEVEGGKKLIADRISVEMPKKFTEKAKFYKLFKAMQAGRTEITHIAEMLNECFIIDIEHNKSEDGKKTYANIYSQAKGWGISAPRIVDPLAGTSTDISKSIRDAISPLRIFLWDNPTKATWDSLYIDGTREVKNADGTTTQESKNWLQEKIMSATNFTGSPLEATVSGLRDLSTLSSVGASDASTGSSRSNLPEENAGAGTQMSVAASDDPLAALGLT
ncbi:hypothetical protein EVB62_022 [Rhizobium phage RHph_TM33]|uniref:Uncharacterized protein n=1 Tax=Rhizobium phage RHph_TM33 TaxID=2509765 RepID=A0A7S5UTA4_9CAUD|nr:hypothetical protein EVB62_022 [Rhizobium phage RHph_TM33]QIG68480.1 hypothetical protein EVB63_021 [Rhizobium phage RHph_TM38]